jgi:pyruvate/2-oxoglutarate/acetoin dehydrogenase E1 component/TPP-dependent pyruvate/acetoin dehydrogenase alpha subunit
MAETKEIEVNTEEISQQELKAEILADYKLANVSRETSLLGRREVLTGKAKFGIFGDGKELAQIALAKQFQNGDFRSGYYRDQTWMMAADLLTVQQFFAQLYAHTDVEAEPASGGRQMNGHYASRSLNEDGSWKELINQKNASADISPTAGQMPRLLGLAQASKVYRQQTALHAGDFTKFSNKGNEVAFGSIGDASTSEGLFWETLNAAGVLEVPLVMSVWEDGYGISVEKKYQTVKANISEALKGFQKENNTNGFEIFKVKAWDYANLCLTYEKAVDIARERHIPILIHVEEVTQPQGHSTSGSHERYKSKERLAWETEYDCIAQFKKWILEKEIATEDELKELEKAAKKEVRDGKKAAWSAFLSPIQAEQKQVVELIQQIASNSPQKVFVEPTANALAGLTEPIRKDIFNAARKAIRQTRGENSSAREQLKAWIVQEQAKNTDRYSSHLYSESAQSPLKVASVAPEFTDEMRDGREILRANFQHILANRPEVLIFGEDAGKIGGVNQGLEGLQEEFGEGRVSDTGIREATIVGQGIGMSMRGLRPIAEIQYLDYLLYCLQILSDDVSTVQYRTKGGQKAPLIIRTRGHRLEGIWHSGSPMGMIVNGVRGMHVCVPRNMVQAAGMYNTLLEGDDPAIVVESLNGYRLKEQVPANIGEFKIPLGEVETLKEGTDLTIVSYGSTVRMAAEAAKQLNEVGVSAEVIDVQTLLPFDLDNAIAESLKKTSRLLIVDEDVPGGASAFILQQILQEQKGYFLLDSEPTILSAKAHRPAYGSDGDYFSKPSVDDIFETAYQLMVEANPTKYPAL